MPHTMPDAYALYFIFSMTLLICLLLIMLPSRLLSLSEMGRVMFRRDGASILMIVSMRARYRDFGEHQRRERVVP